MKPELEGIKFAAQQTFRVTRFLTQSVLGNMLLGRQPDDETKKKLPSPIDVLADLKALFERDWANVSAGLYKLPETDQLENPLGFFRSTIDVFSDLVRVRRRQNAGQVQEVPAEAKPEQFPNYFRQNFHFQTDGYLSKESAERYDHQVELVFAGGADAMRRQTYPFLKTYLNEKNFPASGETISLLDVACGTGRYLRFLKENAPDLKVTGLDLSPFYLHKARSVLAPFERVDFVEANAESIPFRDETFDVLTSIYLFHELPLRAREKVASEMARVVKKGGLLIIEDSIQRDDKPRFNSSLEFFPVNYHEPYYLNYIDHPLEPLFVGQGLECVATDLAFFSKIWVFRKR